MNGLYSLRHKFTGIEEPLFPNIQGGQPLPKTEDVPKPDNTVDTLLKLLTNTQEQPKPDIGENVLLKKYATSPGYSPDITERTQLQGNPEVSPVVDPDLPETPQKNALLGIEPAVKKPTNSLLDYWKQPVIGKMPLDQFVQIAGALSSAIAPQEPMGRVGNVLSQMGGAAYAERVKREGEEPENVLRRRLLGAQITEAEKKAGEVKIPQPWEAYYSAHIGDKDETGKLKSVDTLVKDWQAIIRTPKESTPQAQSLVHPGTGERKWFDMNTSKGIEAAQKEGFIPYEKTKVENQPDEIQLYEYDMKQRKDSGLGRIHFNEWRQEQAELKEKPLVEKVPYIKGKREKFIGKNGKEYEGTFLGLDSNSEPKWGNIVKIAEKPSGADKEITPIQHWGVVSKIEDDARSYANVTVPKAAAGGISFPAGGGIVFGGGIAKEDVDKWVKAYQSHYSRKVEEAKKMGALPKDYKSTPIIEEAPPQKIFKDKQGREMVQDPTSSTGWRYK